MPDILNTLAEMRSGKTAAEINAKYNELFDAVLTHRAKGVLTIKIKIAPARVEFDEGVCEVTLTPECDITKPEKALDSSLFFVTREGGISRNDPAQSEMFDIATTEVNR